MDLYEQLAMIVQELDAEGIPYALCGALALAVHGVPRATSDIDLIVPRDDAEAVRRATRRAGYVFEALPMRFPSGIEVQRFSKIVDGRPLMLDILWATDTLREILTRSQRVPWAQGEIRVVSRPDLITLKLTAGRPQDLADIQALTKLEGRDDPT